MFLVPDHIFIFLIIFEQFFKTLFKVFFGTLIAPEKDVI